MAYIQIRFRVTVAALVVITVNINQAQSVRVSLLDNPKKTDKIKKLTSPQPSPSIEDEGWGKNNCTSQEEKFIERLGH